MKNLILLFGISFILFSGNAVFADEEEKPMKPVPKAYAQKHMPEGWWTDPKIIAEGKKIFETAKLTFQYRREDVEVDKGCLTCHESIQKRIGRSSGAPRIFGLPKR